MGLKRENIMKSIEIFKYFLCGGKPRKKENSIAILGIVFQVPFMDLTSSIYSRIFNFLYANVTVKDNIVTLAIVT